MDIFFDPGNAMGSMCATFQALFSQPEFRGGDLTVFQVAYLSFLSHDSQWKNKCIK